MRIESSIVQYLFDYNIRSKVKPHIESWMFETSIYRNVAMSLKNDIFDHEDLDLPVVILHTKSKYSEMIAEEEQEIRRLYDEAEPTAENDIPYVLEIISEFLKKRLYAKGLECLSENKLSDCTMYIDRANNMSLREKAYTNLANSSRLKELLEAKFPEDGKYIRSSLGILNDNTTYKGYRRGDLVQVVAPPGIGKTSLLTQETSVLSHQDFKVGFAIIGDNEEDDLAIKMCAYLSGMHMSEVLDDPDSYFAEYQDTLKNVNAITYPAGVPTIHEILSDFKNVKKREGLDVLIVDYDANIAQAADSMYESGGVIYKALKAFAQVENCVVIVASQPKIGFWGTEVLTLECANESAKKQHAVDIMITMNKNLECSKVGTIFFPKIRRGTTGVATKVRFLHHMSKVEEISKDDYDIIRDNSKQSAKPSDNENGLIILDDDDEGFLS